MQYKYDEKWDEKKWFLLLHIYTPQDTLYACILCVWSVACLVLKKMKMCDISSQVVPMKHIAFNALQDDDDDDVRELGINGTKVFFLWVL